ncbi:spore germination protein GerPE [Aquibacillus kalidii]|uniref:spore germination protein GerPE n=1 Tax=Aquibacillus kalidii TaxID=2762597 RepID=UPI0016465E07|nr:spore germination protein GerPE [Aquibacillus kalidii]
MNKRTTYVKNVRLTTLSYSSGLEIGDTHQATPNSKVIAVQKEGGFHTDEGYEFNQFPIFDLEADKPIFISNIKQQHHMHNPTIQVDHIDITGVSTSSIVQIGNLDIVNSEARIKHIRILKEAHNKPI